MDEAIVAGFAGSFLPRSGSGDVGAGGGAIAGGEPGHGGSLGASMADARFG